MDYTSLKAAELEDKFKVALAKGNRSVMDSVQGELRRRAAVGRGASAAPAVLRRIEALLAPRATPTCRGCAAGGCPGGHVYVLAITWNGGVIHYVGSTGKTVEERFEDNFRTKPSGGWKYTGRAAPLIRAAGRAHIRFATEYFTSLNPAGGAGDRHALKNAEGKLARKLLKQGLDTYSDELPRSQRARFSVGER